MHNSSEMKAILDAAVTSIQSLPANKVSLRLGCYFSYIFYDEKSLVPLGKKNHTWKGCEKKMSQRNVNQICRFRLLLVVGTKKKTTNPFKNKGHPGKCKNQNYDPMH